MLLCKLREPPELNGYSAMIAGLVFVAMLAGMAAGFAALMLGCAAWVALVAYAVSGIASFAIVLTTSAILKRIRRARQNAEPAARAVPTGQ